ncbi:helix-turn-helix transcriptional regulator [Nocardia sp. NPDC051787]|uniref:helix-turn-helix domain-containing protein n=1 Tax=Nocardia sp. NPDC051787 TaxID=3155415 RepID=UPI00342476C1
MIVSKWTKVEVKALRLAALRLTQEQFAEKIGFKVETIRKWERATKERPVRGESAESLDTELARLTDQQRARFRAEDVRAATTPLTRQLTTDTADENLIMGEQSSALEIEVDVKRREFGMLLGAVFMAASRDADAPIRIGIADARRLSDFAAYLGRQEQDIGGVALVETAVQALETAKHMLDACAFSKQTGRAFMSATGELATIAGWMAYDSELYPLARRCYADAFSLANQAGDDPLTAHVCMNTALLAVSRQHTGEANPHRALSLASRARELTRGHAPGRIHALIATREAQAHGVLGDRTAFGKAIATAWREFDFAAGWATALAEIGDIGTAIEQGISVLVDLEGSVSSTRTLRSLESVRAASEGRSEEFTNRFDELAGKVVTA